YGEAAGVHRLDPPADRHRAASGNRPQVAGATRRPVLRIDVDAAREAEDVQMRDQPARCGGTVVPERRAALGRLADLRLDLEPVDANGECTSCGGRGLNEQEGEQHHGGGGGGGGGTDRHPETPPRRRMRRDPTTHAAAANTTAAIAGETSQETSCVHGCALVTTLPT